MDRCVGLDREIAELERRILQLKKEKMRVVGRTVLLRCDPRYGELHEDTTLNIIAEGILTAGVPHRLLFTYDNERPGHMQVRLPSPRRRDASEVVFEDFSDSEGEESQGDVEDEEDRDYDVDNRVAVPLDACGYAYDLPSDLTLGKAYGFFIIAPSQ